MQAHIRYARIREMGRHVPKEPEALGSIVYAMQWFDPPEDLVKFHIDLVHRFLNFPYAAIDFL